ncbi:hypothetical protein HMSSN139_07370 [Paenibacillus sp. HMSSN-139]|nr:hypothetical protein HMSSN139_07370 [Paenibacillus sp. HMSSN-139]
MDASIVAPEPAELQEQCEPGASGATATNLGKGTELAINLLLKASGILYAYRYKIKNKGGGLKVVNYRTPVSQSEKVLYDDSTLISEQVFTLTDGRPEVAQV